MKKLEKAQADQENSVTAWDLSAVQICQGQTRSWNGLRRKLEKAQVDQENPVVECIYQHYNLEIDMISVIDQSSFNKAKNDWSITNHIYF